MRTPPIAKGTARASLSVPVRAGLVISLAGIFLTAQACGGSTSPTAPSVVSGSAVSTAPSDPAPGPADPSAPRFSLTGGVTTPSGAPIAQATVAIAAGVNSGQSTTSDAEGHFSFPGLVGGAFTARASAAGYVAQSIDVTLAGDQTIGFTLAASAGPAPSPTPTPSPVPTPRPAANFSLAGRVTSAVTGPNGGIAAARVEIVDGVNAGRSVLSDDGGRYLLTGLAGGSMTVKASAPGCLVQTAPLTLSGDQTLNLTLMAAYTTKGRAVDALSKSPVGGLTISGGTGVTAASDASGGFTIATDTTRASGAVVTFTGPGVVEHRADVAVPGPDVVMPLIPASFDLRAFDEMFRVPILLRWRTAPPLHVELRTMKFTSSDATDATGSDVAMSDADADSMVADLSWALPQLTGGNFTNFSAVSRSKAEAGSVTSLLVSGRITVYRFQGLAAATGMWGFSRWQYGSDGTVTGGVMMIDSDFDSSAGPYRRSLRAHELGHALGYNHVVSRVSVMNSNAQTEPTQFDRDAATIAFQRQPGNRSPDIDPDASATLSLAKPSVAAKTATWSTPVR